MNQVFKIFKNMKWFRKRNKETNKTGNDYSIVNLIADVRAKRNKCSSEIIDMVSSYLDKYIPLGKTIEYQGSKAKVESYDILNDHITVGLLFGHSYIKCIDIGDIVCEGLVK